MSRDRGLVYFFGVISIALTILCILFGVKSLRERPDKNQGDPDNNGPLFTVENLVGRYQYRDDTVVDSEGKSNPTDFTLNLYGNGIFRYVLNDQYAPVGVVGNYTINGNTLILNILFNTGSSTDIDITKGVKTFTVDQNYNINGVVRSKFNNGDIKVVLAKTTNEVDEFDLSNFLTIGVHTQDNVVEPRM